jgi:hypothetical protein
MPRFGSAKRWNLPPVHPREPPEPASRCRSLRQGFGHLTHALHATLRRKPAARNKNSNSFCAEAVEDETSLWKAREKAEKTQPSPVALIR